MSIVLGLDLGPNSIGWALIDSANQKLIDLGVRIFPEGVDNFETSKERSRNEDRRMARGMRRQIARRQRRKGMLREALVEAGLWPGDREQQAELEAVDPYALRAQAADPEAPRLTRHELGRVILHLNQRRGFLSHRKDQERDSETQGMLAEMGELETALGDGTLGQFLHQKLANLDPVNPSEDGRIRRRHTRRTMLDAELKAIAARHSDVLTEEVMYGKAGEQPLNASKPRPRGDDQFQGLTPLQAFGLHGIIFFQRSIFWPKSMIGLCELEPKQPRCSRADRQAQRFRMLQEVNNLRYIDPDQHQERTLTDELRALLIEKLSQKEKLSFDQIRKLVGQHPDMPAPEQIRFNLERGERSSLKGHITDFRVARVVEGWHNLPEPTKDAIVRVLIDPERDDDSAREQLTGKLGLTDADAEAALGVQLPTGYLEVSLKALTQGANGTGLVAAMETGLLYQSGEGLDPQGRPTDAIHAAGYGRSDELQRRIFDRLPDPTRIADAPIGDIPNPVVRRALVELRKLVNAIIREHGKPDQIHVEMAREVKQGEKARKQYNQKLREREAKRDEAANKLRENNVKVSRDAINRYLLWEEQEHLCVYTGKPISFRQLYNGEADVDHVLPYSRCLDDSLMNKVVCFRTANTDKGQQAPYEWLAGRDESRYEQICQRARKLPYPKYRRFLQKELELDKFIARQLVDTSYITRATVEYLRCLVEKPHDVLGPKGQLTAELRRQWGLNDLLNPDAIDVKSREDHRHHAIDALVVALTDRSRLQQLTRIRKGGGVMQTGEALDLPWDGFREEVERRINAANVSHRAERKVAGALHEETLYGQNKDDRGRVVEGEFVVRKRLDALSPNEVELIRDEGVKEAIKRRLAEHGAEIGRGKKVPPNVWKEALCNEAKPVRLIGKKTGTVGPPIYKVRVIRREQTIQPIREDDRAAFVKPGSTHHLSLFEFEDKGKTKREAVWTTMLDAADRVKQRQQLLKEARKRLEQKTGEKLKPRDPRLGREMRRIADQVPLMTRVHPTRQDARFLFSLSRGEMVLAKVNGQEELLVYNTSASTSGQMWFHHHADARPKSHKDKDRRRRVFSFMANTLDARKVAVDYLGRIRNAEAFRTSRNSVDHDIECLAKERVALRISQREMKRRLKTMGKAHLGADLTAEIHRLRTDKA